jgi:hypothetical protein
VTKALPPSRLLNETLGHRSPDPDAAYRDHLRASLADARTRAINLAERIRVDLPEFTEHGTAHLDALWAGCDLLVSDETHLSPLEAFTLGASILIHDLALTYAAYPGGQDELRRLTAWTDGVAVRLMRRTGRPVTAADLNDPPADIAATVDRDVLRQNHARQAANLATQAWSSSDGEQRFLIESPELRHDLGYLIGAIAASHWTSAADLPALLPEGAFGLGGWPSNWTVRPLLLACVLRCADAANIDGSRTPLWERVHRRIGVEARKHWEFQKRLSRAELAGDQLRFTSLAPFPASEAEAWWAAYDAVATVDTELRAVHGLLLDERLPALTARGVVGAHSPRSLARHVQTNGWHPVEAELHVSDVRFVIEHMGGAMLYFDWNETDLAEVPLRELLANAADASKARSALTGNPAAPVAIRIAHDPSAITIEVVDHGVGMTPQILTGHLLDFGRSLWSDPELSSVHPGLLASGFQPTGQFGIGFFSVFMWSDSVRVTSRPFREGAAAGRTLEFREGARSRPILRLESLPELDDTGGTVVTVDVPPHTSDSFSPGCTAALDSASKLAARVASIAPASAVTIKAQVNNETVDAVLANDWIDMPAAELLSRLVDWEISPNSYGAQALRLIRDRDGTPIARACLNPSTHSLGAPSGALTQNGFRLETLEAIGGVWRGLPITLSRSGGLSDIPRNLVSEWATEQGSIGALRLASDDQLALAKDVLALGGQLSDLAFVLSSGGARSFPDFVAWCSRRRQVLLVDLEEAWISEYEEPADTDDDLAPFLEPSPRMKLKSTRLASGMLHVPELRSIPSSQATWDLYKDWEAPARTVLDLVLEGLAQAWKVGPEELRDQREESVLARLASPKGATAVAWPIKRPSRRSAI